MKRKQRNQRPKRNNNGRRGAGGSEITHKLFETDDIIECHKNPQLQLLFKTSPHYERSLPLPYEMLMKIFHYLVDASEHPIRDLCSLAQVCETWRLLIVCSPSLWSRIIFDDLPVTDGNFKVLIKLFNQLPAIIDKIREVTLRGPIQLKSSESPTFLKAILSAPNLNRLSIDGLDGPDNRKVLVNIVEGINECRDLKSLTINNSRIIMNHQKWLADYLIVNGKHLEELHLTQSFTSVSSNLFKAIASDYCPLLKVLDLSTCEYLNTRSFDAIQLAQSAPNLVILRVANVSFRRVHQVPEVFSLTKLEELSMPIGMRDADRDDALLSTLTYGSENITTLDLRGSSISAHALIGMPSYSVRSLHMDDLCPLNRRMYNQFIGKWQHSLTTLSLVKINCSETIKSCLGALKVDGKAANIREVDLESSDILVEDLKDFLSSAKSLQKINLTLCRSLPRGCKGCYSEDKADNNQQLMELKRRLGATHSDSETEIDEENGYYKKKRRRIKVSQPDMIYETYQRSQRSHL